VPPPVDPVALWNTEMEQLRARVRAMQDQETALMLQLNQANNQVFAPVTDPAAQQKALAQQGDIQQKLVATRLELEGVRAKLNQMQAQGPPKK